MEYGNNLWKYFWVGLMEIWTLDGLRWTCGWLWITVGGCGWVLWRPSRVPSHAYPPLTTFIETELKTRNTRPQGILFRIPRRDTEERINNMDNFIEKIAMGIVVIVTVVCLVLIGGLVYDMYTTSNNDNLQPDPGDVLEDTYGTCVKINYSSTSSSGVVINNIVVGSGGEPYTSSLMVDLDNGERIKVNRFLWSLSMEELCQGDRVKLEHNVSRGTYRLMDYGKDLGIKQTEGNQDEKTTEKN